METNFLGKYLLVLRYLIQAFSLDPNSPIIHLYTSKLTMKSNSMDTNVANVLSLKLKELFNHPFAVEYVEKENAKYMHSSYPAEVLAAAKVALLLDPSACPDALADLPLDLLRNISMKVII